MKFLLIAIAMVGCSSTGIAGAGGAGGSVAASGMGGALADASAEKPCGPCAAALAGPDHLAGELALCQGTLAADAWAAYVLCGCENGGPCYTACAPSAFCAGITPSPGLWADPIGTCKGCLDAPGPNGCAPEALACSKT